MMWANTDSKESAEKVQSVAALSDTHRKLMEEDSLSLYNIWTRANNDAASILGRYSLTHLDLLDAIRAFTLAEANIVTEVRVNALDESQH